MESKDLSEYTTNELLIEILKELMFLNNQLQEDKESIKPTHIKGFVQFESIDNHLKNIDNED